MMRARPFGARHHPHELLLDLRRRLSVRKTGTVGDTKDMRVYRDRVRAETHGEHDVGCLASDARQIKQSLHRVRHSAAVSLDDRAAGCHEVLRLSGEEPARLDVRFDVGRFGGSHRLGGRIALEKGRRHHIDARVGALR